MNWIFWAPLTAAGLHMFEEFVFPGRFSEWYILYKPDIRKSITWRFLVLINAGLLILCYDVGALGATQLGIAGWLGVMAMLGANGLWHLRGVLKTKKYSPGVITGLFLYLPLALYGYIYFISTDQTTILIALIAFVIGASFQFWSNMFHRFRSGTIQK